MLFSSSHDVERRHARLVPFAQSGNGDHTAQQFAGPDPSLLAELNLQTGTRTRMDILPGYDQGGSALPGSMPQAKPGRKRDTAADPVRCAREIHDHYSESSIADQKIGRLQGVLHNCRRIAPITHTPNGLP